MKIGIDLDDVTANFIDVFMKMSYEKFGRPALGTKPIDWEWSNAELSREEIGSLWVDVSNSLNFWENLPRDPGASVIGMHKLKHIADLFFITARAETKGESTQFQSARWLDYNFALTYPTVIVDKNKGPIAAALGLNYFVDDRPKNCLEIKEAVPECEVFLKRACHNLDYAAPEWMKVVDSFDEFAEILYRRHVK